MRENLAPGVTVREPPPQKWRPGNAVTAGLAIAPVMQEDGARYGNNHGASEILP